MAVTFSGMTPTPQTSIKKAEKTAVQSFQGMQADSVSFGSKAKVVKETVEKLGKLEVVKNFVKNYAGKAWGAVVACKDFLIGLLKKINPMNLLKRPEVQEAAKKAVGG